MTIAELQIQLDLNPDNRINILENTNTCRWTRYGYIFVDQENGQCYLFDINGNPDDINKVKSIEDAAFYNCKSLTKIKIPNSIENIKFVALAYCESLTSIKISNSVKSIGHSAFDCCTSLISIEIPNSIKRIEKWAFANCKSLVSIKIPDSVESIGDCAFVCCTSLKELLFKGKTIKQVKAMKWCPWGIQDISIIKTES